MVIPACALHYATPVYGSPFDAKALRSGDDFPYIDAQTDELGPMSAKEELKTTMQEEVRIVRCLAWANTPCDRLLEVMHMGLGLSRAIGLCFVGERLDLGLIELGQPRAAGFWFDEGLDIDPNSPRYAENRLSE